MKDLRSQSAGLRLQAAVSQTRSQAPDRTTAHMLDLRHGRRLELVCMRQSSVLAYRTAQHVRQCQRDWEDLTEEESSHLHGRADEQQNAETGAQMSTVQQPQDTCEF